MNESTERKTVRETSGPDHGRAGAASLSERVRALRLPESTSAATSRTRWLPWGLCLLFALATSILVYREATRAEPEVTQAVEKAPAKPAAAPEPGAVASSGEVVLESKGYIIPVHKIQVSPKVSGMVVELYFLEG